MDAAELQRHPLRDHPLFAAGMDEQQVFLPILEEPEIAPWVALLGRHLEAARRRQPARHRSRDIGLDAVQRVDGDALALAQPVHQLAVIDRTAAKGRFRHISLAAEFGDLAENLVVFHLTGIWGQDLGPSFGTSWWAAADGRGVLPPSAHIWECGESNPSLPAKRRQRGCRFLNFLRNTTWSAI